ncbi:DUF4159 domain-containing protein [Hyphobacterium sp. CCMP332]|uniref:DUF4159 domain-containing protein n=1 Tax=Hyphobacterium sp. CCMP332 TaxID=2749086 RepID=UPI00164FB8F7|nr:DUF4159 domain-containing protein [Hyphobacterium sp. CCMP332]QNL18140.1 DUF4159 domain-containing protein [Hyphobacterium sp. CCMP332]
MFALGPLAFAAPLALIGLLTLPILWRLLRATPPPPRRAIFPPLRLLKDAPDDAETPHHAPWWLIVFRLLLAALVIIALARPVWQPAADVETDRPLLLVVDNGWASAPAWRDMVREANYRLDLAEENGRTAAIVFTADASPDAELVLSDPDAARRHLEGVDVEAWPPNRELTAGRIDAAVDAGGLSDNLQIVWITDGIDTAGSASLARILDPLGQVTAILPGPGRSPVALGAPIATPNGFAVDVMRIDADLPRTVSLVATAGDGRAVARTSVEMEASVTRARADIELPLDLRNRVAAIRIEGQVSAGGTQLTDDAWRRPRVGVIDAASEDGQPLLSDLHYIMRAIEPFTEARRDDLDGLLANNVSALIMVDAARTDDARVLDFVNSGGLLIRFAGPRLAARPDDLLPVQLRQGGRNFGSALSWEEPQSLAPFAADSPFAGLTVPPEATVSSQVLAEPGTASADRVWARLEDGTPLVTAMRQGEGWVVLFHVTAGPEWSDLPLTGLFPRMLRRISALAQGGSATPSGSGAYVIDRALDGEGRLSNPPVSARPVPAQSWTDTRASAVTPPGIYRLGAASAALNVLRAGDDITALPRSLPGVTFANLEAPAERRFAGPLLALALFLLAIDAVIGLALAGRLPRLRLPRRGGAVAALIAVLGLAWFMPQANAQEAVYLDSFEMDAALDLRFAYVITGNRDVDARSRAGLFGISREITRRSAMEPQEPMAVNVEENELVFFPVIYWPVLQNSPPLSDEAAARVSRYIQSGGLIIFDTQDADIAATRAGAPHAGLARLLEAVDVPALARIDPDHVLTRSFYLLQDFPGRISGGPVWVEADPDGASRDGASGVVIGSNDWASAWATDATGQTLYPVEGGEREREMARRFGMNLAMYALTGNYKADQVHIPALLERLGQ